MILMPKNANTINVNVISAQIPSRFTMTRLNEILIKAFQLNWRYGWIATKKKKKKPLSKNVALTKFSSSWSISVFHSP